MATMNYEYVHDNLVTIWRLIDFENNSVDYDAIERVIKDIYELGYEEGIREGYDIYGQL